MGKFLASFSGSDWLLIAVSVGFIGWLEVTKSDKNAVSEALLEQLPVAIAPSTGLPPSPEGLPDKPYHLRPAPPASAPPTLSNPVLALLTANPPSMYGPTQELHIAQNAPDLPEAILERLRDDMPSRPYFGAFAVDENGAHGWSFGYANLQSARAAALGYCAAYGGTCQIIADLTPQGMTGRAPRNSLTFAQAEVYRAMLVETGPRAYARSLDGASAAEKGPTSDIAQAAALAACAAQQATEQAADIQFYPCELIAAWE